MRAPDVALDYEVIQRALLHKAAAGYFIGHAVAVGAAVGTQTTLRFPYLDWSHATKRRIAVGVVEARQNFLRPVGLSVSGRDQLEDRAVVELAAAGGGAVGAPLASVGRLVYVR